MGETIIFRTSGEAADERLIRAYVFDAVDRLQDLAGCEGVGFNPMARKADLAEMNVEGGVLVRIWGEEVDTIVEQERERWNELVESGLAESWEVMADEDTLVEYMGEQGAERYLQIQALATRMSKLVYEEFDERPDPVDMFPEEARTAPAGVGWWRLLHELTIQQNYRYSQEVAAYTEGIQSAVHTIAEFDTRERALHEIDEVIESLEALRNELDAA